MSTDHFQRGPFWGPWKMTRNKEFVRASLGFDLLFFWHPFSTTVHINKYPTHNWLSWPMKNERNLQWFTARWQFFQTFGAFFFILQLFQSQGISIFSTFLPEFFYMNCVYRVNFSDQIWLVCSFDCIYSEVQ